MDVAVFQLLKAAHQKILRQFIGGGTVQFSRIEFLEELQGIFDTSITRHHIMNGFEKTGLYPFNVNVVLSVIHHLHPHLGRSGKAKNLDIDPAIQSLLPSDNRFLQAKQTATRIQHHYADVFSSPTRGELTNLASITNEAILIDQSHRRRLEFDNQRKVRLQNRSGGILLNRPMVSAFRRLTSKRLTGLGLKSTRKPKTVAKAGSSENWRKKKKRGVKTFGVRRKPGGGVSGTHGRCGRRTTRIYCPPRRRDGRRKWKALSG